MKLYAPISYYEATEEERRAVCNGCGAKDGMNVPDTMYGLDISEACHRHDWMWEHSKTLGDKLFSDAMFLLNLTVIIINGSNWLTKSIRLARATKYFVAVATMGTDAYWKSGDKITNSDLTITIRGEFR